MKNLFCAKGRHFLCSGYHHFLTKESCLCECHQKNKEKLVTVRDTKKTDIVLGEKICAQ